MRRTLVGFALLAAFIAGCGSSSRGTTAVQRTEPPSPIVQGKLSAEARATDARERREEQHEQAEEERTSAREAAQQQHEQEQREAHERAERANEAQKKREHEWTPATRARFINAMVEAAPHGESPSRWRAIGECAVKELESQYTEAELGSASFKTAEVEAGIKCGERTP
jgi:hypothetical protein